MTYQLLFSVGFELNDYAKRQTNFLDLRWCRLWNTCGLVDYPLTMPTPVLCSCVVKSMTLSWSASWKIHPSIGWKVILSMFRFLSFFKVKIPWYVGGAFIMIIFQTIWWCFEIPEKMSIYWYIHFHWVFFCKQFD